MLDIEYIKQIDEVLEVEGFELIPPYQNKVVQMTDYTMIVPGGDIWILGEEFRDNKLVYPLYLQRVIEAINKNDDFLYKMDISKSHIFISHLLRHEATEVFPFYSQHIDEAKEKAIIYIMDHIKEKVWVAKYK